MIQVHAQPPRPPVHSDSIRLPASDDAQLAPAAPTRFSPTTPQSQQSSAPCLHLPALRSPPHQQYESSKTASLPTLMRLSISHNLQQHAPGARRMHKEIPVPTCPYSHCIACQPYSLVDQPRKHCIDRIHMNSDVMQPFSAFR